MELEALIPDKILQPQKISDLLNSSNTTVLDILTEPLTYRLFRQEDPQIIELYVFIFFFLTSALLNMFQNC